MSDPIGSEKLRRPGIALVLSILTIGLGQLYSTRPRRAVFFYGVFLVLWLLYVFTRVTYSLAGLVLSIAVAVCFAVFHLSDAWRTAKKAGVVPLRRYNRRSIYVLIVVVHQIGIGTLLSTVLGPPVKAYRIPTSSMEPALHVGDFIVADRKHFDGAALNRGDVVLVWHPMEGKGFFKRVIGLPGETIEMHGEQVLIDGRVVDDPWGAYRGFARDPDFGPIQVPPRAYFVLGDNRNNSWDSRAWGCVRADLIKAQALYIYWARDDKRRIGKPVQ